MSLPYGQAMTLGQRDPVLRPYEPVTVRPGWLIGVLLLALLAGDVVWRILRLGGVGLPYGLTDGVILAAALARRVTSAVHGPPVPLPPTQRAPTTEFPDRPFIGARRWEDRLAWTHDDPVSFNRTVRPQLAQLVDERLRHDHGIDLAGNGNGGRERVRVLLGDPLWTLLSGPVDRVPGPAELTGVVAGMERLFAGREAT